MPGLSPTGFPLHPASGGRRWGAGRRPPGPSRLSRRLEHSPVRAPSLTCGPRLSSMTNPALKPERPPISSRPVSLTALRRPLQIAHPPPHFLCDLLCPASHLFLCYPLFRVFRLISPKRVLRGQKLHDRQLASLDSRKDPLT